MQRQGILVANVAWPEIMARLDDGATAILPVGASCKEHGPHLPVNTDYVQAQCLSEAIVKQANVVVWPVIGYGYYPAFTDYPGSCSLSYETFCSVVMDVIRCIARAGAARIRILNTGISTIDPIEQAMRKVTGIEDIILVNIYAGQRYRSVAIDLEQQDSGGHADELETSIMLAIDPTKVDMSKAVACNTKLIRGPFNRTNPQQPNYSPSGVYGDPRLASADKGLRLLNAIIEDILEVL